MKFLIFLVAVSLHQALSQGCVDQYANCQSYENVCQSSYYQSWLENICQKTCINYCKSPLPSPLPSQCGAPQVQTSRVISGDNAQAGAWPWQILLLFNGRPICGGSLISPTWVVTAAHCINRYKQYVDYFKIRAGEHNFTATEGNEQEIQVAKIFEYPGYESYYLNNDVALLKLKTPAQFGKYASPVCLPKQGENVAVGTECYITGWGKIKHPGSMHPLLQQAKMPIVSNNVCENLNTANTGIRLTRTMVCAGSGGYSRISGCHGDSGGPLVCKASGGSWVLQGAVSWGSRYCSSRHTYTVFARMSEFRNWIDQIVRDN